MHSIPRTEHLINHFHLQHLRRPDICTGSGNRLIAAGEDTFVDIRSTSSIIS